MAGEIETRKEITEQPKAGEQQQHGLDSARAAAYGSEGARAAIGKAEATETQNENQQALNIEPLNYASSSMMTREQNTIQNEISGAMQGNQDQAANAVQQDLANDAANDPAVQKAAEKAVDANTPVGVSDDYKVQMEQQMAQMLEQEKLQNLQDQEMAKYRQSGDQTQGSGSSAEVGVAKPTIPPS